MLNYNHISTVLVSEIANFTSISFLYAGFFMWLGHIATRNVKSNGAKTFWFIFACFLLYETFQSSEILFNMNFYVAFSMMLTHSSPMFRDIKEYFKDIRKKSIQQRRADEYEKQRLKEENQQLKVMKNKNEKNDRLKEQYLINLSKKLDMF